MNKKIKKNTERLKQTKDYYPIINPDTIEDETNISIPSEQDKKRAKNWVDSTEKIIYAFFYKQWTSMIEKLFEVHFLCNNFLQSFYKNLIRILSIDCTLSYIM